MTQVPQPEEIGMLKAIFRWICDSLGLDPTTFIAGFLGSCMSFKFVADLGVFGRMATFIGGMALANIMTPPLADYFHFSEKYFGGIGLMLGVFGMGLIAAVLKLLKDADLWALVRARFSKSTGES